jgi:hypothetical protein
MRAGALWEKLSIEVRDALQRLAQQHGARERSTLFYDAGLFDMQMVESSQSRSQEGHIF